MVNVKFDVLSEYMVDSIYKNIQEIAELCIDKGIHNAYSLMDVIESIDIIEVDNKEEV